MHTKEHLEKVKRILGEEHFARLVVPALSKEELALLDEPAKRPTFRSKMVEKGGAEEAEVEPEQPKGKRAAKLADPDLD